jgi:hypothetical protein
MCDRELVELYELHISGIVHRDQSWLFSLPPSEQDAWRRWNLDFGVQQQGTGITEGLGTGWT